MDALTRLRGELTDSLRGSGGTSADRLCQACVEHLDVDGAAISVVHKGVSHGTVGSSGTLSRRLDDLQFVFGEGPCMDAVRLGAPVLVEDLRSPDGARWPMLGPAVLAAGIRAMFALPVVLASAPVGALDLFREAPDRLDGDRLHGSLWAAQLAVLPILDLVSPDPDDDVDVWDRLDSLQRVEVYQATGMIIAQLDVDDTEALLRLRAYAFSHNLSISEAAWAVIDRRVVLEDDGPRGGGWTPKGAQ